MKMSDYLQSLLPSFTKQRIIEDIEAARGELEDNTLEPLKQIKSALEPEYFEKQMLL
jgi:hypothetical protein